MRRVVGGAFPHSSTLLHFVHIFTRLGQRRAIRETFGVEGEFTATERAAVHAKFPFLEKAEAVRQWILVAHPLHGCKVPQQFMTQTLS